MNILLGISHQGLIFSLVALAVMLSSRIIQKDDLTCEGSFGIGGAVTAIIISQGYFAPLSLLLSLLLGGLLGATTGVLYTRFKMNHLMAGLCSSMAAFSLSLALASANKIVDHKNTVFSLVPGLSETSEQSIWLLIIVSAIIAFTLYLLKTNLGLMLKAVGENPSFLLRLGHNPQSYQILGFALGNAITALAGSLFVQWSGFFSITGNVGILVTGLSGLMLQELLGKRSIYTIIIAACLYQSIFALTIFIGIPPVFNNLGKALIIVLLIVLSNIKNRR